MVAEAIFDNWRDSLRHALNEKSARNVDEDRSSMRWKTTPATKTLSPVLSCSHDITIEVEIPEVNGVGAQFIAPDMYAEPPLSDLTA